MTANNPPESSDTTFYATMREQIAATPMPARPRFGSLASRRLSPMRPGRRRLGLFSGVSAALTAAIVTIALTIGSTPITPPAFALVRHPNGSVTVTIYDLTGHIRALNARFRAVGIPETVLPVYAGCHSAGALVLHPDPLYETSGSYSFTWTPGTGGHPAAPGYHYALAAKRVPGGKVIAFIGALKMPLPSCFGYSSTPSDMP